MRKRTKYLLLSVIVLGVLSIITSSYSYAKYVSNYVWNYYLETKGFYFSSDQLDTTKIVNVNNNWNFDRTYFTLRNSDNDFLVSDYDIDYTVKCVIQNDASEYSKCILNGSNSDVFNGTISSSRVCKNNIDEIDVSSYNQEKCESNGYEWSIQENYKDLYFDIISDNDEELNYVSVLIEVTTTSPYSKTLVGEFNLSSIGIQDTGLKVDYKEFDNYSRVIISNSYDEDKCVKLSWDSSKLIIDENSKQIKSYQYDDNGYINQINLNIDKKNSISYVFYKTDFSKTYNYQEFDLIESNDC